MTREIRPDFATVKRTEFKVLVTRMPLSVQKERSYVPPLEALVGHPRDG